MAKQFTEGGLSNNQLTDELIPSMTIWMGSHSGGKDYTYIRYRSHIYTNDNDRTKDEYEYSTYEENKVYYLDDNWDTVTRILDKICGTPAGNTPKCAVICWESSPLNQYMYLVYNGEEYISLFATPHSTTKDYGFYRTYKELLTHISELNKVYKVDANLNTSSTVYVVPTANQSIQWKHNDEANFITKSYNAIPAQDFDSVIVTPILTEPLNDSVEEGATTDDGSENTVFTRRSYNSLIDTLKSNCTSGSKAIEVLEKMKFTLNCSPENTTSDSSNTTYEFAFNTKTVNYTISYKGIVEEINKIQASIRNKTYAKVVNTNNATVEILDMYDSPMTSDAQFWTRSEFGNLVPISTTGLGVDSNGFIVGNYTGYVKQTLDSTTTTSEFRVLHAGNKHSSASYKLGSIKTANLTRSI